MTRYNSHPDHQEGPHTTMPPRRDERDRLRRDRVIGHTILGVAALTVFVATLPIIGGLVMFTLGAAAFYLALRSFTFAISIKLGDPWGWNRDGGLSAPLTWSDRIVIAGMAWLRRRSEVFEETPPAPAVQILPVESPE
jgi:hypothetical protein